MAFLLRLGQFIASSRESKDFWRQLLRGLEPNHPDVPFAVLYSAGGESNEELSVSSEKSQSMRIWALEGAVRVIEGAPSIPSRLNSESDLDEFLPNFLDLMKKDEPTILLAADGTLPQSLVDDIKVGDNGDICEAAVFLPIRSMGENVLGFLIIGINTRKRYDDDYELFIHLLSRQLATSIAAAVLFEDETRRARIAAEQATQDRNYLSRRLAIQTHEALEIESRFRRMADLAPVGMFHISPDGCLLYANEHYYELTEHPRGVLQPMVS
jgi:PAS domain-containing protein